MIKPRKRLLIRSRKICMGIIVCLLLNTLSCFAVTENRTSKPPNIIIVLTDDQGFGDLGRHGNPDISTPTLDKFASESVEFTQFYVCPVCAPTRSSLMTGRYNFRTKVVDTWKGRSLMDPQEVTLAEVLKQSGYRTGIFGKWHLGDNYPMRAIDEGFDEAIVHRGGGIAQPSCPPGNSYFDPILLHNGKPEKYHGYCMDVYTEAAMAFIEKNRHHPFFVYLATNTPHTPLQISADYVKPYRSKGLEEPTAKVYGMITNIDDNFKRLMDKLRQLDLEDDTLIIFLSDNGPQLQSKDRYRAGLRGSKGTVYEGGIRVPCFMKWGDQFKPGTQIDRIAAHIDIMPTILDICNIPAPSNVKIDGKSLSPLLSDKNCSWEDRNLFFQWHRGDEPQQYRCFAVRNQQYKFLKAGQAGKEGKSSDDTSTFELYDITKDPFEKNDISQTYPEIAGKMKAEYDAWFEDVCSTRGFETPEIFIGTNAENPTVLTHEDRKNADRWGTDQYYDTYWCVNVTRQLNYQIKLLLFNPAETDGVVHIRFNHQQWTGSVKKGQKECSLQNIRLPKASGRLKGWVEMDNKKICPWFVTIQY